MERSYVRLKSHLALLLALTVVVALVAAACDTAGAPSPASSKAQAPTATATQIAAAPTASATTQKSTAPASSGPTKHQLGEAVKIGNLLVTVNGVSQPTGNELLQPDAGQKFIAVDVTLVNQGSTAEAISTLMQMAVKDSSGKKYDVDLGAQASTGGSNGTLDGMLAPGDKVRGDVAFSVPANMTNSALVFVFTPGLVGTPVTFSLGG